ncbi:MAG TPA: serine/threonine-protein kinase [Longimicrobium sp.]|nr:serine/threonine-protein kinase [Longimicrobium sp.]
MKQPFERLLLGHTLAARYRVDEVVGAGGMSVVFRGHDLTLGRPVAVKVVSIPADSDGMRQNLRERFRREAASAASIPHHPNVVQVYDYGTDPALDLDFIVMELLRGHDLKDRLARGAPPHGEAMRIVRDAARGVAAGHRAGILHRDVKPANVFLVGTEELEFVRVLDFGIAKPLRSEGEDALTTIGQLPHSPAYASPEQLDPDIPVTAASDVYQLGLVAFETLTGERPFTQTEREHVRAGEEIPLRITDRWAAVPAGVRAVIAQSLHTDPSARFPDASEFVEALVRGEEERTVLHAVAVPVAAEPVAVPPAPEPAPPATATPAPIVVTSTPAPLAEVPVASAEASTVMHHAPPPPVHPAPVHSPADPPRTAARRNPLLIAIPLLLLTVIGLWALSRGGGDEETAGVPGVVTEDSSAVAGLDETFAGLQGEAAQTPSAALPTPATPGAPVKTQAQIAAEVEQAVRDLNDAWVQGDIERHVKHYASRVNYYNSKRLSRGGIRRDRTRDLKRYSVDRRIVLHNVAVTFPEPDQAHVLVDKEWIFRSEENVRRGRGTQEYRLKRDEDDGKWYVTSEQLLRRTEESVPAAGAGL